MSTAQQPKTGLQIDLNFRQLVVICLMFGILFVMPVQLYHYLLNYRSTLTNETYTQTALVETDRGQVAGVSTTQLIADRYYQIPVLNFNFDTQLKDTTTIYFLFGIIMILTSIVVGAILLAGSRKDSA